MDGNDDDTISIDWSSFIIENAENKDNGETGDMLRIYDDDEMYAFLGLGDEDEEMNGTHPEDRNQVTLHIIFHQKVIVLIQVI
jgi:hypothetical protein